MSNNVTKKFSKNSSKVIEIAILLIHMPIAGYRSWEQTVEMKSIVCTEVA